jgi:Mn2+/Fe2+ NRAMP family transporter
MVWMAVVGLTALRFVFAARRLYQAMEKVMLALVMFMLVAFIVNLLVARPVLSEVFRGFIPSVWPGAMTGLVTAMVATTFSVIAALYQSTMAQQKGWGPSDLRLGLTDTMVGIGVLTGISIVITMTSASVLRGAVITDASGLARQLDPLLGHASVIIFSLGFLAASFSSTIVNAMIGGGLLADSMGMSSDINARPSRMLTAFGMAVGMAAGIYTLFTNTPIGGIVLAQKSTILAVPLCALVMIVLANDKRVVGTHRNSLLSNAWAVIALLVLVWMSVYRVMEMLGK